MIKFFKTPNKVNNNVNHSLKAMTIEAYSFRYMSVS